MKRISNFDKCAYLRRATSTRVSRVRIIPHKRGKGIDKPNVRFVAHLDPPKSLEAYLQETGRAGRDGLASDAWMVYGVADIVKLRRLIADSEAPRIRGVSRRR